MDPVFKQTIRQMMKVRLTTSSLIGLIRILRAFLLGLIMLYLWSALRPDAQGESLLLAILVFLLGLFIGSRSLSRVMDLQAFLKSLEIKYPAAKQSAFSLKHSDGHNQDWYPYLKNERFEFRRFELRRLAYKASTLVLPAVFCVLASQASPGTIQTAIYNMKKVVADLNRGTTLEVVDGLAEEGQQDTYQLTADDDPHEITLLTQNMIKISVQGSQDEAPFVKVKPRDSDMTQSFRLTPASADQGQDQGWLYTVSFTVPDHADLYVSSLSANQPAVRIQVKKLPVPEVELTIDGEPRDPWPDDQPLPLTIKAKGKHPLQLIRLLITTDGQTHEELVNNILSQEKMEVTSQYSLLLETYVRRDLSQVEIVAEAIDRHLPNPLVGRSKPLVLRTASAYGRYRETLRSLRQIKTHLDEAVSQQADQVNEAITELSEKALNQAEESPFFDGLDRHIMRTMDATFQQLVAAFNREELLQVSEELNRFLFEHETLDDRERDRDFFVAARSLSRLIEQDQDKRSLPVKTVTKRMQDFLDERHQRWQLRTEFLGTDVPDMWQKVQNKPFHQDLSDINDLVRQTKDEAALRQLSQTVSDYREWLEKLEQAEEQKRQKMKEQRQQGLADARNNLRQLQKRQGKISQKLDRAANRSEQSMSDQWGSIRMEQNANISGTEKLEAQLRSLSPLAAERIKAALESMELTVKAGNDKAFVQAESASDLAGRLLRQADSAARRSQQQRESRGRRRRVTSDQYYGSPVAGGDIEIRREYQVNPRYREEILEQVRRAQQQGEKDDRLLESYLRKVIR
jgi:hypothetical protein